MKNMFDDTSLDAEITKIEPIYDFKKVANGHFLVYFGFDDEAPLKLSFAPFLDHLIKKDKKLFDYLKNSVIGDNDGLTVSHAICDLYEIGFPVDQWVKDYIEMAKNNINPALFNALLEFYTYLKNFGDASGSLEA
jgi:hypothetical protein